MSLLNVIIGDRVGWVAFDTDGATLRSGAAYSWSKAIPLVHANTIFACRGERVFLGHIFIAAYISEGLDSFDDLELAFPRLLSEASAKYVINSKHAGADISGLGLDVRMVGWSAKRGNAAQLTADRPPGATEFVVAESACTVAPSLDEDPIDLSTVERMTDYARRQVAQFRKSDPGLPIGGTLMLADLTEHGMSIRKIAELG